MYGHEQLAANFIESFDQSGRDALRAFVGKNRSTKWMIAADFVLHDPSRAADVFSFSIVPYDLMPADFEKEVQAALSKDLKRSKAVDANAAAWLHSGRAFHFAIRVDRNREIFDNSPAGGTPLEVARAHIDETIKIAAGNPQIAEASIKRLKKLRQLANAKSFATELLGDVWLLGLFFGTFTALVAREIRVEKVGWFPDRDNMTTWCDGIWQDYAWWGLHAVCDHMEIDMRSAGIVAGKPEAEGPMWYDHLIRSPDWFAGTIAAWDLDNNLCPDNHPKYVQMIEEAIADNNSMLIYNMEFASAGVRFSRLNVARAAPKADEAS